MLEPERLVQAIAGAQSDYSGTGDWLLNGGYLGTDGAERGAINTSNCAGLQSELSTVDVEAFDRAWVDCLAGEGIESSYVDVIPAERLALLRTLMAALAAAIAALGFAAGAIRLRRAAL